METQSRRSSVTMPSTKMQSSSSLAKRQASSSSDNLGKVTAASSQMAKKRPALANLTNLRTNSHNGGRGSASGLSNIVPTVSKIVHIKKGSSASTTNVASRSGHTIPASSAVKPRAVASSKGPSFPTSDVHLCKATVPTPCSMVISPSESDNLSVSMDETMSSCDSLKSPDVEYVDSTEVAAVDSIERKTCSKLYITEKEPPGNNCKRDFLATNETTDKIIDLDDNLTDPQLCATMAGDIYKYLRDTEEKKRPSADYMEKIQRDISASMRAILIDWLVEVAEEYRLIPDTLYLTVNYIDRYLSGNVMDRQRLQLLGVACMMIAAKYEEICAPQVEEFCYITDNTYFKDEVLQMESSVLNYLKFEMTAPTTKCFLRRFLRAAQGANQNLPPLQIDCIASYLAELSLQEYSMLQYAPSVIAASAVFLAIFMLIPRDRPWNDTLKHYTLYEASDLRCCVTALHNLFRANHKPALPAIRAKYSQHKYKFAARRYCNPTIPPEYFQDPTT